MAVESRPWCLVAVSAYMYHLCRDFDIGRTSKAVSPKSLVTQALVASTVPAANLVWNESSVLYDWIRQEAINEDHLPEFGDIVRLHRTQLRTRRIQ